MNSPFSLGYLVSIIVAAAVIYVPLLIFSFETVVLATLFWLVWVTLFEYV